jgi:addiction module HigA family antidote
MATTLAPVHPGEVLLEEFLEPLGISEYRLAKDISVPPRRINEIVHGNRAVTADTALRLARYFGTSDRFWLNLQPATTWMWRGRSWVPGRRPKSCRALANKELLLTG